MSILVIFTWYWELESEMSTFALSLTSYIGLLLMTKSLALFHHHASLDPGDGISSPLMGMVRLWDGRR